MITKDMLEEYGYTEGCEGCKAIREDSATINHNYICRKSMEQALSNTDEGRERVERGRKRVAEATTRAEERQTASRIDTEQQPVPEMRRSKSE